MNTSTPGSGTSASSGPAQLQLAPTALSVREARHFVRALLADAGRERWADDAELALSEVVTNAVLHAHTDITVTVELRAGEVEIGVSDGNPTLPTQRGAAAAEATTGRGLELIAAVTRDRGVRPSARGKVVWFTIGDEEPVGQPSEEELLDAWDLDAGWEATAPVWQAERAATREVVLLSLPPTLWLAAREHHQTLLRELVLFVAEHPDAGVSAEDIALADEARTLVWSALTAALDQAHAEGTAPRPLPDAHPAASLPDAQTASSLPDAQTASLPAVPDALDLRLPVPPRLGTAFGVLQDVLDIAERLAEHDRLLVRPGLPEIIALRDWLCEQVVAQLAGVGSTPWAGADQPRFTELVHDRAQPDAPRWDSDAVTDSDRGVVAADDANRIIAVSRPLADAVGWDPAELVGRRVVALVPPSLREAHVAGFTRHLSTGHTNVLGVPLELPVLHRDGREIPCSFLVERADVTGGRPVYLAWITPLDR